MVKVGQDSTKSVKEDGSMPSPGEPPRYVKLGGEVEGPEMEEVQNQFLRSHCTFVESSTIVDTVNNT